MNTSNKFNESSEQEGDLQKCIIPPHRPSESVSSHISKIQLNSSVVLWNKSMSSSSQLNDSGVSSVPSLFNEEFSDLDFSNNSKVDPIVTSLIRKFVIPNTRNSLQGPVSLEEPAYSPSGSVISENQLESVSFTGSESVSEPSPISLEEPTVLNDGLTHDFQHKSDSKSPITHSHLLEESIGETPQKLDNLNEPTSISTLSQISQNEHLLVSESCDVSISVLESSISQLQVLSNDVLHHDVLTHEVLTHEILTHEILTHEVVAHDFHNISSDSRSPIAQSLPQQLEESNSSPARKSVNLQNPNSIPLNLELLNVPHSVQESSTSTIQHISDSISPMAHSISQQLQEPSSGAPRTSGNLQALTSVQLDSESFNGSQSVQETLTTPPQQSLSNNTSDPRFPRQLQETFWRSLQRFNSLQEAKSMSQMYQNELQSKSLSVSVPESLTTPLQTQSNKKFSYCQRISDSQATIKHSSFQQLQESFWSSLQKSNIPQNPTSHQNSINSRVFDVSKSVPILESTTTSLQTLSNNERSHHVQQMQDSRALVTHSASQQFQEYNYNNRWHPNEFGNLHRYNSSVNPLQSIKSQEMLEINQGESSESSNIYHNKYNRFRNRFSARGSSVPPRLPQNHNYVRDNFQYMQDSRRSSVHSSSQQIRKQEFYYQEFRPNWSE